MARHQPSALLAWALAPEWVSTAQAALLLGIEESDISELADIGALVTRDGAIERQSLAELQEVGREVAGNGQQW